MEEVKPKFLNNSPIGDDLFEGKSQEKIGIVVANILKDKNFQIIGIDGAWGTGKSNLVQIVEKKLPEFKFFIYDVWGHQEDDQRKAILVELTELISSNENTLISNKKKWNNNLKNLLAKQREVTTINRPYLGIGFILSLFLIIYSPTISIFAKESGEIFGIENKLGKTLLILFPLFLIFIIYLFKVSYQIYIGTKCKSFKIAFQQTFQVYTNKQEEETKIETISENEPSVKDFRNWMREIDLDLGNNKLVLVFDNFDRLPKQHILSIWSSIHIFFAEEKYENIKVIIPFDRVHIQNAFSDLNSNKDNYANDYINKTFDLVYRVSSPIMSSWKVFFESKWKEAFTTINATEFYKVLEIYEVFRKLITPREIIACINEIVSIKLLDKSIPDRYIALFVLNKEVILDDPLKAIVEGQFLSGLTYLYKDDADFQKYITALSYQINPKDALEVAYRKQLKDSLMNNEVEVFVEISKTNVFSKIITSVISELSDFQNPILILDKLNSESKISKEEIDAIWETFFLKLTNGFHDSFQINESQKIITKHVSVEKGEKWIKQIIVKLKRLDTFESVSFSKLIDEFDKYLKNYSIPIDIFNILQSSVIKYDDAESFTNLVKEAKGDYKKYTVTTENIDLIKYLNILKPIEIQNSDFITYILNDFDLKGFKDKLENDIELNKGDANILGILFKKLKQITEKPLNVELKDSEIYNLFLNTDETNEFYYDLIAMRLSYLNNYNAAYSSSFTTALNLDDDDLTEKVAERIEYYIDYDDFLINGSDFNDSVLYKNVAQKIISNDYGIKNGIIKDILQNFEVICRTSEIEPHVFINDLDYWNSSGLNSEEVITFPLFLFKVSIESESETSKNVIALASDYFESINNKDEWVIIFNDLTGNNFQLLKIIEFQGWTSYSLEGLKECLIELIINKKFSDFSEWSYLLKSFTKSGVNITNTLKDIRDKFYTDSSLVTKDLFLLLLEPFIENLSLNNKPGEAFRTFIKPEFLDSESLVTLMIKNASTIKTLLNDAKLNEVTDFKQAARDRKDTNTFVNDLSNKLDIRSTKK